jgi:hypothetical protein
MKLIVPHTPPVRVIGRVDCYQQEIQEEHGPVVFLALGSSPDEASRKAQALVRLLGIPKERAP